MEESQNQKCPKIKAFNEPSEPIKADFYSHVAQGKSIKIAVVDN